MCAKVEAPSRDFSRKAEVDELHRIVWADHDVLGLEVAMDHSGAVDILKSPTDSESDAHGALGQEFLFLIKYLAQNPALDPFHHHVNAAGIELRQHLHHTGMIEFAAEIRLSMKAIEE